MSVLFLDGKAQTGLEFYSLESQYNSFKYNPAFLTSKSRFTLSIFPFAGTSIGYNNQQEIQSLIKKVRSGVSQNSEYIDLVRVMVDRPGYTQRLESELLSFTYRDKEGFWNFRVADIESFSASVQGPVSLFMLDPDVRSVMIGQVQDLPGLFLHYREYSLGYSNSASHKNLSLGIRAKLYYGKAVVSSDITGTVKELAGTYYMQMQGLAKMSAPEQYTENPDNTITTVPGLSGTSVAGYMLNSKNPGFGIDLGLKYKISDRWSYSLSMTDLGAINWKNNLNSKKFNSDFQFSGYNIESKQVDGVQTITKTTNHVYFDDELSELFQVVPDRSFFSTRIPTTFYTGFSYQLNPIIRLNLTDRLIWIKDMSHNSLSLNANIDVNKTISVSTGYAVIGATYTNMPLAVVFNLDFGQIYLGTDNLLSVALPGSSQFAGYSFGMCFYLFRKINLYSAPTKEFPYHKPKKVRKSVDSGLIRKKFSEF